jgi:hypothetical protein
MLINLKNLKEGNKMFRTIETSDSDKIIIQIPKEYINKNLEIYVLPVGKETEDSKATERDVFDEYYGDEGYQYIR